MEGQVAGGESLPAMPRTSLAAHRVPELRLLSWANGGRDDGERELNTYIKRPTTTWEAVVGRSFLPGISIWY